MRCCLYLMCRACVDLACLLKPGEGLLVGSFARCLFLVHSECEDSQYINSRPFRVNAGPVSAGLGLQLSAADASQSSVPEPACDATSGASPVPGAPPCASCPQVHAYVQRPGERTAYLSELQSGSEVLVAGPSGRQRTALVGRVKIEVRPLVLVQAATAEGQLHSILLQNAETVKLVGPAAVHGAGAARTGGAERSSGGPSSQEQAAPPLAAGSSPGKSSGGTSGNPWRAISVSELRPGDRLFVHRQAAARHTGLSIEEQITEK